MAHAMGGMRNAPISVWFDEERFIWPDWMAISASIAVSGTLGRHNAVLGDRSYLCLRLFGKLRGAREGRSNKLEKWPN